MKNSKLAILPALIALAGATSSAELCRLTEKEKRSPAYVQSRQAKNAAKRARRAARAKTEAGT